MAGYPDLPTRDTFGPERENVRPIRNPAKELGADEMNLSFWQIAGAGRTLPLVLIIFDPALAPGSQVKFQALAFDPQQELPVISPVINGVGSYTWTFETTYPNERGTLRPFTPKAGMAMTQGAAPEVKAGVTISGQDVIIAVQDAADLGVDAPVIFMVW